jgi:hypothetical protein
LTRTRTPRTTGPLNEPKVLIDAAAMGLTHNRPYAMKAATLQHQINRTAAAESRAVIRASISPTITAELFPEGLFLNALTEGLALIRPEAVDICSSMMVRYSVIHRVTR